MKQVFYLFFSVTLITVTSCNKEPVIPIKITGIVNDISKANSTGFEVGDEIGVYVVDYVSGTAGTLTINSNHATNVKHSYNSDGSFTAEVGKEIYWNDNSTNITVYGYYPYFNVTSITEQFFSIQTDQSTVKTGSVLGGYEASDFLWAKDGPISPFSSASLEFAHKLSRITISLEKGDGYTLEEYDAATKTVIINGTKTDSKIDLSTGIVTVNESSTNTSVIPLQVGDLYSAIIVPQTATDFSLAIEINNIPYTYKTDMLFKANTQNNVVVTVNKTKLDIKSNNIQAWEEDPVSYTRTINPDDPKMVYPETDLQAVVINGLIWAPVNCGYIQGDSDYKYGKLFQWGRKDGQGNQNCSFSAGPLTSSSTPTFDNPDPNTYYMFISSPWDWRDPQLLTWEMDNTNPCPTGWRVPTKTELESLLGLGSTWIDADLSNPDGLPGRWFGTNHSIATTTDPKDCIFLPAAGYRNGQGSDEGSRNIYGVYWSTTPEGIFSVFLEFTSPNAIIKAEARVRGNSIRCVKEL